MATGMRNAGEFCWINMITPDPDAARAFFGTLLGWTYVEISGMGWPPDAGGRARHRRSVRSREPHAPPGTPPHIGVMVKVASANAMVEKVAALGGKALPAFDIVDQGRMAVCFDPNGAPSWFETMTSDGARATPFYAALFGWTPEVMAIPGGGRFGGIESPQGVFFRVIKYSQ